MKKYDSDKQAVPPKVVVDAALQTDSMDKKEESCQTDGPERRDFQVQATFLQGEPISTQTDCSTKCDFQAQVNIPRDGDSKAVQTIKEEIAMPNLPSSVAQTPAKKRRMSSVSASKNTASIDLTPPQNPIPSKSGDGMNNQQADVRSSADRLNNKQSAVDDVILNSEVYKIYCRNKDPKEAMKQIKELKTCLEFRQPKKPFPAEEDFKRVCERTLKKLWKMEPRLRDSKFTKIKKYIADEDMKYNLYELDYDMYHMLHDCFTFIRMIIPNGYEYWYVANFEKGINASKWFRVESSGEDSTYCLAELNVMGITKATIDKFQYLHHLKKNSTKMLWFDFAYDVVRNYRQKLFPNNSQIIIKFRVINGI